MQCGRLLPGKGKRQWVIASISFWGLEKVGLAEAAGEALDGAGDEGLLGEAEGAELVGDGVVAEHQLAGAEAGLDALARHLGRCDLHRSAPAAHGLDVDTGELLRASSRCRE